MGIAEDLNRKSVLIGFEGKTLPPKTYAASGLLRLLDIDHGEMWCRAISGVARSVLYGVTQYRLANRYLGLTGQLSSQDCR